MDRTDPDPKAPVDADLIEATYRFYLGRSPHPETAQALIDRQLPLRRLENNMVNSREYWKKGPVLATHRRGRWDGSILVVDAARILFCPIAKVANTSVKDWALRLSGHTVDKPVHTLLDSGKQAAFYPGALPEDPAHLLGPARQGAEAWLDQDYQVMRFAPAPLSLKPGEGPPHIRLDRAAQFLFGDRL